MDVMQQFENMSRADYDAMLNHAHEFMKGFLQMVAQFRSDVLSASDDVAIKEISIITVSLAMEQNMPVSQALGAACTAYIIKLRNQ